MVDLQTAMELFQVDLHCIECFSPSLSSHRNDCGGPIIKNSILVAVLSAVGTFLKGWNEFKQYRHKLLMSAFA